MLSAFIHEYPANLSSSKSIRVIPLEDLDVLSIEIYDPDGTSAEIFLGPDAVWRLSLAVNDFVNQTTRNKQ